MMKSINRLTIAVGCLCGRLALAGIVTGQVTTGDRSPAAGIPVSDGISVVCTDADGRFQIDLKDGQPFLFIHQPDGWRGAPWFVRKPQSGQSYSFTLHASDPMQPRSFLQISDTETANMDWVAPFREYHPDFLTHTGDLCRKDGIVAHARTFTEDSLGYPVYFAIGNHDVVAPWDDGKNYPDFLQPYYYSFDWGPYLVVAAPMWAGDVSIPYNLQDFADWLQKLLAVFPKEKPVIVLCHALWWNNPDVFSFPGHDGRVADLSGRLAAWCGGHYHFNRALELANGGMYYCTAPAEMGGIDHSPAATREFWLSEDGKLHSRLHWDARKSELYLTAPGVLGNWERDGREWISATGWRSGSPIEGMEAQLKKDGQSTPVQLVQHGAAWSGEMPEPSTDFQSITLVAHLRDGRAEQRTFPLPFPAGALRLKWLSQMDSEAFMTAPVAGDGKIFTAAIDDHEAKDGAVYAWDRETGKAVWKYRTGASVRNTIVYADGLVFFQDTLGNVFALHAVDGAIAWADPNPARIWRPTTNGVCVHDGVLYAGCCTRLSAYEAATGRLLWRNSEWENGEPAVNTIRVDGSVLVTGTNWDALLGFDVKTGKQLWRVAEQGLNFQTAAVCFHDGKIYAKGERTLEVLDLQTGAILQGKELPDSTQTAASPVFVGNTLVVGGVMAVYGLDADTLEVKWQFVPDQAILDTAPYVARGRTLESTPVVWRGLLWFGANDGNLYALQPETGTPVCQYSLGSPILSAALPDEQNLFLVDFSGRVYCLEATDAAR